MTIATLSSKFQISIPKKIRDALDFQPGQEFEFIAVGRSIRLVPKISIKDLAGSAESANPADYRDRGDQLADYSSKARQRAGRKCMRSLAHDRGRRLAPGSRRRSAVNSVASSCRICRIAVT